MLRECKFFENDRFNDFNLFFYTSMNPKRNKKLAAYAL